MVAGAEIAPDGRRVWSFTDLKQPCSGLRLTNGNALIADAGHNRQALAAERLDNGNPLIAPVGTRCHGSTPRCSRRTAGTSSSI